jgi:stage V sporulation protein B
VVKILGAVFRIPLGNMVSETSMAYYQPAYYIYTFFIVIATSGIPVAISRMVSERAVQGDYRGAHRAFKVSAFLMFGIGAVSFLLLFFGAGAISAGMSSPNAKYPMMVIAPALLLVPLMAAYRGYFQGMQNMNPTAVSQVIEQVFRVGFGLSLAYLFYRSAPAFLSWAGKDATTASDVKGAMGAISGATIGSAAGLALIIFIYMKSRAAIHHRMDMHPDTVYEATGDILKKVLLIAVPITIGAAVMPIMNMVEVPIINSRLLAAGFTPQEADVLYGTLSGYVMSLINLPQVLTAALAMSLVPMITSVFTQRDTEALTENTVLGMRIATMIGLPCAFGMAVLSHPIMLLLYPTKPQVADNSAACLTILAIGIIFLSIVQTLTAILQGVGKQMVPVINLLIAVVIKIVVTFVLVGIPTLNIRGAAIGTTVAYLAAAVLDILAVKKYVGVSFPAGLCYLRPAISAGIMAVFARLVFNVLTMILGHGIAASGIATMLSIFLAACLYAVLLIVTKSCTRDDLLHMPKGHKLAALYDRFVK